MSAIPLDKADRLAAKIVKELAPFCDQIEVAGSIRRRRPFVNDIDLVVLPKRGQEEKLRERCRLNATVIRTGPQMMELRLGLGITQSYQVDLWIAHPPAEDLLAKAPTNFGSLLLCRTGSKEHNIWLVTHAKLKGLKWNPHHGVFSGDHLIASATEAEIFAALDLPFIKPEEREAGRACTQFSTTDKHR